MFLSQQENGVNRGHMSHGGGVGGGEGNAIAAGN
jgi:hypothetical protein